MNHASSSCPSSNARRISVSQNNNTIRSTTIVAVVVLLYVLLVKGTTALSLSSSSTTTTTTTTTIRPVLDPDCYAVQSAIQEGMHILESDGNKGLGAFCATPILKGAWVGEYKGELITIDQVESRYWKKKLEMTDGDDGDGDWQKSRIDRNQGMTGDYLFDMGDDLYMDGEDSHVSGWCRFVNHSDDQNVNVETRCSRQIWNGKEIIQPRLWFVALRDIARGEELLYDYGDSYWDD